MILRRLTSPLVLVAFLLSTAALANKAKHELDSGGGRDIAKEVYGGKIVNAPKPYNGETRLTKLSEDPAHGGAISDPSIREGMAGLRAEAMGLVSRLVRGPAELEFYDGHGHPYDVKTPPSPMGAAKWKFSAKSAGDSILKQLRKQNKNHLSGHFEDTIVILDSTYLAKTDHASLWQYLHENGKPAELDRILEVHTH